MIAHKAVQAYKEWILRDPVAREVFAPEGVPLVEGQLIKRTTLAATLRKIAKGGANAFYEVGSKIYILNLLN
jgi:gamma-glutamyltranspeptidase